MPDTLVLLFLLGAVFAVLTWLIPAGQFEVERLEDGRRSIAIESFRLAPEASPGVGLFSGQGEGRGLLNMPFDGLASGTRTSSAVGIVAFLLVVGGAFGIILRSGSVDRGLRALIRRSTGNPTLVLPVLFVLFSLGGAVFGMGEETIPFMLLLVPLLVRLGYDAITAVLVCFVATQVGFATSWMNPFSVAIAQGIAGVPPLSGAGFRIAMWAGFTALGAAYVTWYAARVRARPERSLSFASDAWFRQGGGGAVVDDGARFSAADALNVAILFAGLGWVVWGVVVHEYYIPEIAAQLFATGLLIGLCSVVFRVGGLGVNDLGQAFRDGAATLLPAALVVGVAKGLVVLLGGTDPETPAVMNTVLYALASVVDGVPELVSAWLMFVVQTAINFLVPSGSGQAALTMPIMAPLGELVGVTRQVSVLAFQLGDGITNIIVPTSAKLMGVLGVARLEWTTWLRFILPAVLAMSALALAVLAVAVATGFS